MKMERRQSLSLSSKRALNLLHQCSSPLSATSQCLKKLEARCRSHTPIRSPDCLHPPDLFECSQAPTLKIPRLSLVDEARPTIKQPATERCRLCPLTSTAMLRRHGNNKQQYFCQKGCVDTRFRSQRDRSRRNNSGARLDKHDEHPQLPIVAVNAVNVAPTIAVAIELICRPVCFPRGGFQVQHVETSLGGGHEIHHSYVSDSTLE